MTTSDHQSAPDPAATYQGRELTARRRWLYRIATPIGLLLVRFFWATCRIRLVLGEAQALEGLKDGPIIPVFGTSISCFWENI